MVRGFIGPFIWCVVTFLVMATIIDIFSFLDDIIKFKIPITSIIAFYVYYLPTIFIQVTPMAVLLATIYILSNSNKHNEIIAMKSGGISLWRVLTPILIIGLAVSAFIFVVNDKILPISSKVSNVIRRDELEKMKSSEKASSKILNNVAVYGTGNRIVFAKTYDTQKKILTDIIMHEHDASQNLISKIAAKSGVWTPEGWKFYDVLVCRIDNSGEILGAPAYFKEKIFLLKERPSDFANREWRPDFMSYRQLKKYIDNFKGIGTKLTRSLLVELHYKISFAFISFIIILIGAPFALITTRGGVLIGVGMSIAIGLLYYAAIAISLAFGKAGLLPPFVSAWLGNVLFAGLGIYLINRRV